MDDIPELLRAILARLDDSPPAHLTGELEAWRLQASIYKTVIDLLPIGLFVFAAATEDPADFRYFIFRGQLVRDAGYFPDLAEGSTFKNILSESAQAIVLAYHQAALNNRYGHGLLELPTGLWYNIYYRPLRQGNLRLGLIYILLAEPPTEPVPFRSSLLAQLSPRQREIIDHLLNREDTSTIAQKMGIKKETVQYHIGRIMQILGVGSRTDIVSLITNYRNH